MEVAHVAGMFHHQVVVVVGGAEQGKGREGLEEQEGSGKGNTRMGNWDGGEKENGKDKKK